MSNWIDKVLEATDMVETPKSFLKWSLFSAIAAVTSPNVWLNKQGAYDLSPNIYVMLFSESGIGKGFGVWLAKSLVSAVDNTRVFSGRNTIQKIISDLSISYTRKGKEMIKDARAFLASGEFINLFLKDEQSISIITEWYDTHYVKDWPNSLKSTGTERLKNVNITLLGGTTPDYLREAVPSASVKGGFFARVMFVWSAQKGKANALIDEAKEDQKISQGKINEMAEYLRELSKLKGEMKPTEKAREAFRSWYYPLQEKISSRQLTDKTGYINRIHDHALKIAMILSLADDNDMLIKSRHIEEGISLSESVMTANRATTLGMGLSAFAPKNEAFLRTLFRANGEPVSRLKMLQANHPEFDSVDLDRISLTMEDAGFVKTRKEGSHVVFQMTEAGRKEFLNIQERIIRKQRKNDET